MASLVLRVRQLAQGMGIRARSRVLWMSVGRWHGFLIAAVLLAIAGIACGGSSAPVNAAAQAEPAPAPPRPWIYVEYEGRLHAGRSGSYCWPADAVTSTCVNVGAWEGFDGAPTVRVKRGDEAAVVVQSEEH